VDLYDVRTSASQPRGRTWLTYETEPTRPHVTIAGTDHAGAASIHVGHGFGFYREVNRFYTERFPDPDPNVKAVYMGRLPAACGRGEPFRGKFRNSMSKPEPFTPGKPEKIEFWDAGCVAHVSLRAPHHGADPEFVGSRWWIGTRNSSWIFRTLVRADFQKATERRVPRRSGTDRICEC